MKKEILHPGDLLLLYTDGITEAENQDGIFSAKTGFAPFSNAHHGLPPQQFIEILLTEVRLFTGMQNFNDDVSLVAIKVEEPDEKSDVPVNGSTSRQIIMLC